MNTDLKVRRQLQQDIEKWSQQGARKVLKGDLEGAQEKLVYVNIAEQLLAAGDRSPEKIYLPIAIGLLCLLLASMAWTTHISTTEIRFRITAEAVRFQIMDAWLQNEPFATNSIYINNLDRVIAHGLGIDHAAAELELQGKALSVTELGITDRAKVEMEVQQAQLMMYIKEGALHGKIEVAEADIWINDDEQEVPIPTGIPETLDFFSAKKNADPVKAEFQLADNWTLSALQIQGLDFQKESPPGSGNFVSTIQSGTVELLETGAMVKLEQDDQLSMAVNVSKRFTIVSDGKQLAIVFSGSVDSIKAGPEGFIKNLAPTWLNYLYYQKQLALFWSAVIFFWGLLWSAKHLW